MVSCPRCGAAAQPGARHCSQCGAPLTVPAPPPPPGAGYAPPAGVPGPTPQVAAPKKDTGFAETLILLGALLGAILPLLVAFALFVVGGLFSLAPGGGILAPIFGTLALFAIVIGVLGAAAGLYARNVVRQGDAQRGGLFALVIGAVMFFTGDPIAGIVMLAGGFLAYTAK